MPGSNDGSRDSRHQHRHRQGNVREQAVCLHGHGGQHRKSSRLVTTTVGQDVGGSSTKRKHDDAEGGSLWAAGSDAKATDSSYYPAYCHKSSATWFEWVKLTAHDIHYKLHTVAGFHHSWLARQYYKQNVPQLLFYLNHPIQFVQIVGVVVSFEEYFERFWLFTIDDSSGSTIDVTCRKPDKENVSAGERNAENKDDEAEIVKLSEQVVKDVQVGAILQIKGTITVFQRNRFVDLSAIFEHGHDLNHAAKQEKSVRQLTLQRVAVVHNTNQEMRLVEARTKFHSDILDRPWILTSKRQDKLRREAEGEDNHQRTRARKRTEKEKTRKELEYRDVEEVERVYAAEEMKRKEAAGEARMAGVLLNELLQRRGGAAQRQYDWESSGRKRLLTEAAREESEGTRASLTGKRRKTNSASNCRNPSSSFGQTGETTTIVHADATMSFGIDDDEKSALLRAAFGM